MSGLAGRLGRTLLATGIVLGVAVPAWSGGASAATVSRSAVGGTPAVAGQQLWVSRYNAPANGYDGATGMAVSPDSNTVFVTGWTETTNLTRDYATVAYDAATGAQLWVSPYNGPGNGFDIPGAIAVSPDGGTVYVTGVSDGVNSHADYATIAYDASTGAQLWVSRYDGQPNAVSNARALVVSPDGSTVYVTGFSSGKTGSGDDYVTIAYNAATGAGRWVSRYNGPANGNDQGRAIGLSPDGSTVYVTGRSAGSGTGYDDATIAYNAATGAKRWVSRYNNARANGNEFANAIAVAPGGSTVYVTGGSAGRKSFLDFATIAYNAATGAQRWVSRYNGPGNFIDSGRSVAVSPDGRTVAVTGSSWGKGTNTDYATIAYNARTGTARWTMRYATTTGYAGDDPAGVVFSPDGGTVYVTGDSGTTTAEDDYATVAYSTATGAQLWVTRYDGPASSFDGATALAIAPDGSRLFVTGFSSGVSTAYDFATIAYQT